MRMPCDPEGEALRQAVLAAYDDASRKAAFETFQKRAWQFLPYIAAGQLDTSTTSIGQTFLACSMDMSSTTGT
jgi:hypothetical protein